MPTIREIADRIKNGEKIFLIDLRSAFAYRDFHIDGSINVPFDNIASVIRMIPDRAANIYFFCGSGHYSRNAVTVLEYKGYTNVYDLGAMD